MDEFLTTRQVQDILQVDRITIYRMLGDGRLKGVKIGSQWRFTRSEVERLLKNGACCTPEDEPTEASVSFPTHCVQTILDLFTSLSGLGAVLVDAAGEVVVESGTCGFCQAIHHIPCGRAACEAIWQDATQRQAETFSCPAGLHYMAIPIRDGDQVVAWALIGQYAQSTFERNSAGRRMTGFCGEPSDHLDERAEQIPVLTADQLGTYAAYPQKVAASLESILRERALLVDRLQKIAAISAL